MKKIDVRLYFVSDIVESMEVRIEKTDLEENPTYVLQSPSQDRGSDNVWS